MSGNIRVSFFKRYENRAPLRDKTWDIDIEYADEVFNQQGGLCALTGIEIDAGSSGCTLPNITASLDRINNSKGYERDNVQWVHKDINMMRGPLSVEKFIKLCVKVANWLKR